MSIKQSRNVESGSEATETEMEILYSEDVKAHVDHFNRHAEEIAQQIDDLVAVGCDVLDALKRRFVSRMESVKDDLMTGVQSQNAQWEESSKKSREDLERLLSIKELVRSLGLSP